MNTRQNARIMNAFVDLQFSTSRRNANASIKQITLSVERLIYNFIHVGIYILQY